MVCVQRLGGRGQRFCARFKAQVSQAVLLARSAALYTQPATGVGTLAAWAHVDAYRRARPSLLAPVTYFRLATGLAAGAWFFGDTITVAMAMGVGLILVGAWYSRWP